MDAALTRIKHFAFFFTALLLAVVPAAAQVAVSTDTINFTPIKQVDTFNVLTAGSTVNFTITKGAGDFWYSVNPTSGAAGLVPITVQMTSGCLLATCAGTITVTNNADATDKKTVAVNYSNAAGTGAITANPATINISTLVNTQQVSGTTKLSTTSLTPVAFQIGNVTYGSSGQNWLQVFANGTSVIQNSDVTLTALATPTGLATSSQPYTASFQIIPTNSGSLATTVQVNLTVGSSSTTGTITPNPTSMTFNYPGGPLSGSVNVTNTAGLSSYNLTTSSQNNWLQVFGSTYTQVVSLSFGSVTFNVNQAVASLLPTGTYTGAARLENPLNSNDFTSLNFTLNVNGGGSGLFTPGSLSFTSNLNGSVQNQSVSPTTAGNYSVSIPQTCNTWLNVGLSGSTFTFSVFPYNLTTAGTYTCNVPFTNTTTGVAYGSLPVSLVLGGGGSTSGNPVGPTTLNFAYQAGVGFTPAQQQISVGGTGTVSYSVAASTGTQFITASGTNNAPGTIYVGVIGNLPAGNYSGTLNVTTPSGTTPVTVNLMVSANPVLTANPGSFNTSYKTGDPNYVSSFTVQMSDNSSRALTITPSDSWITVAGATSTSTPASYQVTLNPAGLANGLQLGSIKVETAGAANTPMIVPVAVLVTNSGTGNLTLSANSLTFTALANGAAPAAQNLTVSANTSTNFSVSVTGSSCSWLGLSPSGSLNTTQNPNISVSVNQTGLAANTTPYTCNISLTSGGVTQTVPVSLTVNTGATGNITVTPASLTFTGIAGGVSPTAQAVNVKSASGVAGVAFTVNATTTSGGNWLNPGTTNGMSLTTPTDFAVSASTAGLTPNTYQGSITYTPSGGTAVVLPVTLVVQSASVGVSNTSLSFNLKKGDPAPPAQTVQITGGTGLTFAATASSAGNWLKVTPATGTTGSSISISVDASSLTPNTYTGTVTVNGTGGAAGTATINVTLTVTAPLPVIDKVTNAGSNQVSGSIAPGEIITIVGSNLGPATLVQYQIDATGKFATTLSNTQVLINNILAPLVYTSATQVAAIVPYDIAAPFVASPTVKVIYQGQTSAPATVAQTATAPGMFTANSTGGGPGAILNANNSYNLPGNGAAKGEVVQIFLTGEGQTNPASVAGKLTNLTFLPNGFPFTPQPIERISVLIDSLPAQVIFWGEAPNLVSGVLQINAVIPAGTRTGEVPIQVLIGSGITQAGVTVSVK